MDSQLRAAGGGWVARKGAEEIRRIFILDGKYSGQRYICLLAVISCYHGLTGIWPEDKLGPDTIRRTIFSGRLRGRQFAKPSELS